MKISIENVEDDVRRVKEVIGRVPDGPDYQKHGCYSLNTVKRKLGSWNKCTDKLFGQVTRQRQTVVERACERKGCHQRFTCKSGSKKRFCSHSCSNMGVKRRRKKRERGCEDCGTPVRWDTQRCGKCRERTGLASKTLGEIRAALNGAARYSSVRGHARRVVSDVPDKCFECGYDKYVHVCHVKPLSEFPDTATVGEVNSVTNLVKLCPNHHWEHDHGLLQLGT